ncbi:MAG: amidophosphoribosyltransferase [Actinobacteria bacterium]|nr:amidophosphoribosyltransferase [Actinomycetota bacterium]
MCGIAGILYKDGLRHELGRDLITMLDGCQHRGPDSTGFALYHGSAATAGDGGRSDLRLRFFVGEGDEAQSTVADIRARFAGLGAEIVEEEVAGTTARFLVRFDGDLQQLSYAMEHEAKLASIGESLDIIKDVGSAHDVDDAYGIAGFDGTHGIGHVRLATESAVSPEAGHPFWATGFSDIAIVHNGQITNYYKMRRRLEKRGFEFHTDNDSELIAVYLADKLAQGAQLEEALAQSIQDLDGTFSFLVSTKDEIGYAKDRLAAKPMVLYEDGDIVAVASEEVSLNKLFPGRALETTEPAPGTYRTWRKAA